MAAVVQIAYTFTVILCQEWNRSIMQVSVHITISDGTTGFLDENWSSIAKKIKKSKGCMLKHSLM